MLPRSLMPIIHSILKIIVALQPRVVDNIEELDCGRAASLTQEPFVELSRRRLQFPRLRRLIAPDGAAFPNVVYEYLATAHCFPVLEELANVRSNSAHTCDPIRVQAFFKQSPIKVWK